MGDAEPTTNKIRDKMGITKTVPELKLSATNQ